jgi:hypothetical protein
MPRGGLAKNNANIGRIFYDTVNIKLLESTVDPEPDEMLSSAGDVRRYIIMQKSFFHPGNIDNLVLPGYI